MRRLLALVAIVVLIAGACQNAGPSTPSSTPVALATASTTPSVAAPTTVTSPSPTRRPCILNSDNPMSTMTAGRCIVVSFNPSFSFDAPADWSWSGFDSIGGFFWPNDTVPSEGEPLNVTYYRYGGFVAKDGCVVETGREALATASELVDWIVTLSPITTTVEERQIDGRQAWLVDIKVNDDPSCVVDTQHGVELWSFEGRPDTFLALGEGGVYRVYVIDSPTGIMMMAVQYWKLENRQPYFDAADALVSSLAFD